MTRTILVLAVIAAAVWVGMHIPHHSDPDVFQQLFLHLMPAPIEFQAGHPIGIPLPDFLGFFTLDSAGHETGQLILTNLQVFQIAAVLLVVICFSGVAGYLRTGQGDWISKLFAGFVLWVRDDMVRPVMGKETVKYLPYFLWVFFFILFMNLLGLVPGGATATANIFVTAALAAGTLVAMVGCGMYVQGPVAFWKNLVPHVPAALWPVMFVIEVVGLLIKPVALTIRLFANMTGGHMIVLSAMGLIMFFAARGENPMLGWASAPLAGGFGIFIMIIESFVACLQAYIFTMLSVLFVNTCIHPEH